MVVSTVQGYLHNLVMRMKLKGQHTTAYTPKRNGVAKRKDLTMVEMARSMLSNAHSRTLI